MKQTLRLYQRDSIKWGTRFHISEYKGDDHVPQCEAEQFLTELNAQRKRSTYFWCFWKCSLMKRQPQHSPVNLIIHNIHGVVLQILQEEAVLIHLNCELHLTQVRIVKSHCRNMSSTKYQHKVFVSPSRNTWKL
jgi:hypothetical protein